MSQPYTLTIGSWYDGQGPSNINCSARMLGWWLNEAFGQLEHVVVRRIIAPAELTEACDFLLVHTYLGERFPLHRELVRMRLFARYGVINFLESVLPGADLQVLYLPVPGCMYANLPISRSVLQAFVAEKVPGSVLLDHLWPNWLGTEREWTVRLYTWLEQLGRTQDVAQVALQSTDPARAGAVAQSRTFVDGQAPSWVQGLTLQTYYPYLEATAAYETFVVTHAGSYNHSVLDMAARGIRVLVPRSPDVGPFVPEEVIKDLGLATFGTCEELAALLAAPVDRAFWDSRMAVCTDMFTVARDVDRWCQQRLETCCGDK